VPTKIALTNGRLKRKMAPVQVLFRVLIPVAILLCGWIGYSMLSVEKAEEKRPEKKGRVIKTQVVELRRQNFQTVVNTHGIVRPHNEASLTSQVSGKAREVMPGLQDGAFFAEGDVLLALDDEDFEADVVSADAQLARATAAYSQEEAKATQARLNWEDLGYKTEPNELVLRLPQLREAAANVKAAEATLARSKRDLTRTKVRAPFDGRVLVRAVAVGQTISPGTSLATIFQTDFVEVRLPIAARQLGFLSLPESADEPSVEVRFFDSLNKASDGVWHGDIVGTEGALDVESRELFAIARIMAPFAKNTSGDRRPPLRIGQPVRGEIRGRVLEDVFVIPRSAVRELNRIYLVDKESLTLDRREIEPAWGDNDYVVVRDDTIPDGSLLATTRLVYSPNDSKVEILPDVDDAVTSQDQPDDKKPG
jgi:RND family efflux transporter MFP subunit